MNRMAKHGLIVGLLAVLVTLLAAGPAEAEVTKFYNKTLSLSGDCTTTTVDDVPDPGCPGGAHPPEGPLAESTAVATDPHGDIYVINRNTSEGSVSYHIDVFDPAGHYLTNVALDRARYLAVDSTGHLYVYAEDVYTVYRFDPTLYNPVDGEIAYGGSPITVHIAKATSAFGALQVNPANDHLFIDPGSGESAIEEYEAAIDGVPNTLITNQILSGKFGFMGQMAFDWSRNRLYVYDTGSITAESSNGKVRVFEATAPYNELSTIEGPPEEPLSEAPAEPFLGAKIQLAADEETGHVIVANLPERKRAYEYDENGNYIGTIKRPPNYLSDFVWITIDNSDESPNQGYLFIPTGFGSAGHLYAYEPKSTATPPQIESLSFSGVTEDEAVLQAVVNPQGAETHWVFEYISEEAFEATGDFTGAQIVGEGKITPGSEGVSISAPVTGLSPGTSYRFRVRAENQCQPGGCSAEREGTFASFAGPTQAGACSNQDLRTGFSANLPDCRAYELVTPPNTGGAPPSAPDSGISGMKFGTPPASPDGQNLAFMIFGGLIPGFNGTGGGINGDSYSASRTGTGWQTEAMGPSGEQVSTAAAGGLSADHGYLAVTAGVGDAAEGPLMVNGESTNYVRYPDGSFHLAEGTLGSDPKAEFDYIAPVGAHIIFHTKSSIANQLEPEAAPSGTAAIYDRTPDGVTHVVSLLPGGAPASSGQDAAFLGSSDDGSAIAFRLGSASPIYVRVDNVETLTAAPSGTTFAGLSADGRYLFYMLGGDLYRFDTQGEGITRITELGDVRPVNIAPSGGGAYFLSGPTASPKLSYWNGESTVFVATVTERDAEGGLGPASAFDGLGLWLNSVAADAPAILASRTTSDGSSLLFVSRANLTGFEAAGKAEIYHYAGVNQNLVCISCSPNGSTPTTDASLLAYRGINADPLSKNDDPSGVNAFVEAPNLSADGQRAFFETTERLANADTDGLADVYEWEEDGKGTCATPGGCIFLISSGQSGRANHLFGVTPSGDDVFFQSADLLVAQDTDETPSIYDARVDGGFAAPVARAGECLGEACQPVAVPPNDPTPTSSTYEGKGNGVHKASRLCPKGKRKVRKAGKVLCVKKHSKRHKHRSTNRTSTDRRAHR